MDARELGHEALRPLRPMQRRGAGVDGTVRRELCARERQDQYCRGAPQRRVAEERRRLAPPRRCPGRDAGGRFEMHDESQQQDVLQRTRGSAEQGLGVYELAHERAGHEQDERALPHRGDARGAHRDEEGARPQGEIDDQARHAPGGRLFDELAVRAVLGEGGAAPPGGMPAERHDEVLGTPAEYRPLGESLDPGLPQVEPLAERVAYPPGAGDPVQQGIRVLRGHLGRGRGALPGPAGRRARIPGEDRWFDVLGREQPAPRERAGGEYAEHGRRGKPGSAFTRQQAVRERHAAGAGGNARHPAHGTAEAERPERQRPGGRPEGPRRPGDRVRSRCGRARGGRGAPPAPVGRRHEGLQEEPPGQERDHRHVAAEERRIAEGGRNPGIVRLGNQAEQRHREAVVARDRHQRHEHADGEVGVQERAQVFGGAYHRDQHQREGEPVRQVHDALHPRVGGPEAALRARAEPGGQRRDRESGGEQRQQPRRRRPPGRPGQRQQRPQRERSGDDRARVHGLADHERVQGLRRDHQRGQDRQRDAGANQDEQRPLRERPAPDRGGRGVRALSTAAGLRDAPRGTGYRAHGAPRRGRNAPHASWWQDGVGHGRKVATDRRPVNRPRPLRPRRGRPECVPGPQRGRCRDGLVPSRPEFTHRPSASVAADGLVPSRPEFVPNSCTAPARVTTSVAPTRPSSAQAPPLASERCDGL